MRYTATTVERCTVDQAKREAIRLCQAIDQGDNGALELKFFQTLSPVRETADHKTEIEFTCQGRQFRVRATTK